MRFDIHYATTFEYASEVTESHNELRAAPASDDRQHVLHYAVRVTPPARIVSYTDYWGTRVDAFGVRPPHRRLEVVAEATVDTQNQQVIAASPRFEELEDPAFRDRHLEFLDRSAHCGWDDGIEQLARERIGDVGDDVIGAALALHRLVGTSFEYTPGTTYVGVPVTEVFAHRRGVCQDFAHGLISACRSVGIPARYVSGYLFARDGAVGADPEDDRIEVQTHAWVEVAIPGGGWLGLDPTNRQEVGPRHIKIGHGRDYDDISPMRGVYSGPPEHELSVSVELRRIALQQQQQQQ